MLVALLLVTKLGQRLAIDLALGKFTVPVGLMRPVGGLIGFQSALCFLGPGTSFSECLLELVTTQTLGLVDACIALMQSKTTGAHRGAALGTSSDATVLCASGLTRAQGAQ